MHSLPEHPLVSIVTPSYQAVDRLQRCLNNVRHQSYDRIEHIVVDGGSTDGSVEVLQGSTGVTWVSEPDRGQSHAINKGFGMANGDVVAWLNSDDLLAEGAVARAVATLRRCSHAGWTYGTVRMTGTVARVDVRPPRTLRSKHFYRGTAVPQPGSFFARWAVDEVGPLAEDLHYAMDLDLWCRFFQAGIASARVPGVVAEFEVHPDSKSGGTPHVRFVWDQAAALARNGMSQHAAATYGRAAALAAWTGEAVESAALEHALQDVRDRFVGAVELADVVEVGLRAEEALLHTKRGELAPAVRALRRGMWRHEAWQQRWLAAGAVSTARARSRFTAGR